MTMTDGIFFKKGHAICPKKLVLLNRRHTAAVFLSIFKHSSHGLSFCLCESCIMLVTENQLHTPNESWISVVCSGSYNNYLVLFFFPLLTFLLLKNPYSEIVHWENHGLDPPTHSHNGGRGLKQESVRSKIYVLTVHKASFKSVYSSWQMMPLPSQGQTRHIVLIAQRFKCCHIWNLHAILFGVQFWSWNYIWEKKIVFRFKPLLITKIHTRTY